jgi:hypothetical protein
MITATTARRSGISTTAAAAAAYTADKMKELKAADIRYYFISTRGQELHNKNSIHLLMLIFDIPSGPHATIIGLYTW